MENFEHTSDSKFNIHPTAVVAPGATLSKGVKIGPYAIIGPQAQIGEGVEIGPHVVIDGKTTIGPNAHIFQFASVGADPQDVKYKGEVTSVEIGENTIIREFVTIHRGTDEGGGLTSIGNNCIIMAYSHIAHDCRLGNGVIMANGATLGGHVVVGNHVVMGGLTAVHQFCHIGDYAFLGAMSGTAKDIPPYVKYWGQRGKLYGLNKIGLKRHGFSRETLQALEKAYNILFKSDLLRSEAIKRVEQEVEPLPEVKNLLEFVKASKRGIPNASLKEDEQD